MDLKELLLKDLSARLPYGVICRTSHTNESSLTELDVENECAYFEDCDENILIIDIKPYLRPMSSMTEEEIKELSEIDQKRIIFSARHLTWHLDGEVIDYLNKKMLDWRGLIHLGLALAAPKGMY